MAVFLVALLALLPDTWAQNPITNSVITNSPAIPRRPSIILILADDLGCGDLSCYGQKKFATPNLDRLASEGIRFTSYYAGSPADSAARAALMLGQHSGHLSLRGNAPDAGLQDDDTTVAQVLQAAGYRTGLVGEWGLATQGSISVPQKKGFDEFAGFLTDAEGENYYSEYIWRYDPGKVLGAFDGQMQFSENSGGKKGQYMPDLFTEAAVNFIKNNKPDQFNKHRPFFLVLSYPSPRAARDVGQNLVMEVPTEAPYSSESWPKAERRKAALISRMDSDVSHLLAALQAANIFSNTVVFFSSDNGPHSHGGVDAKFFQSAGTFRGGKGDLTEGGLRVPMIVRWPARVKPGQVSDFTWAAWDFLPTVADIAFTKPPANGDGISILPALTGKTQTNRHDFLYWESHENGFAQAIRTNDWKAIRPQAGAKLELYNLKSDAGEKQNVADKNPEVVAKLEAVMKNARTDSKLWPIQQPEKK